MLCKFMSITEINFFFLIHVNVKLILCLFHANVCQCHRQTDIQTYKKYRSELVRHKYDHGLMTLKLKKL